MQPGLRRFRKTIAAGKSELIAGSTFDGFRITGLTDGATLSVQIAAGEIIPFEKGMAWQRDAQQPAWNSLRVFNDGASSLDVTGYAYVGGQLEDDRLSIDASSALTVFQRNEIATAKAQGTAAVVSTAADTDLTIIAAGLNVNGLLILGGHLYVDPSPGAQAILSGTATGAPILTTWEGATVTLPNPIRVAAGELINLRYRGFARYSLSYKAL